MLRRAQEFCERYGLKLPIIEAPMAGACHEASENNLSIANLDFEDFSSAADPDGILRGFREF